MNEIMEFPVRYFVYAESLPPTERLAFYDAVFGYAFVGVEPEQESAAWPIFNLIKPGIDSLMDGGGAK